MYTGESNKFTSPSDFFINVSESLNIKNIRIYYLPDWTSSDYEDFFSFNFSRNTKFPKQSDFCYPDENNPPMSFAEYNNPEFFKDKNQCKNINNCDLPTDADNLIDNNCCKNLDNNLAKECGPNFSSPENNPNIKNVSCCEDLTPESPNNPPANCKECNSPLPNPELLDGKKCKNNTCKTPHNFYVLTVSEGPGFFRNATFNQRTKICTLKIKSCISKFDDTDRND